MPLMGSLYIGASGLQTGQNALNTTAHNLSNMDTTGYTRQQVTLSSKIYNTISKSGSAVSYQQLGLGVNYSRTRQVRDQFLDKTYRRESGRSAFYETSTTALNQIEDIMGESNTGISFSKAIDSLSTALEQLNGNPGSGVNQGLFISSCNSIIEQGVKIYESLCQYQDNLNTQVQKIVGQINGYAKKLAELNNQIVTIESGGFESANDLRDTRNSVLDELGKLGKISYVEDADGYVSVQLEGTDLVKHTTVYNIGTLPDENGFYTPFWESNALRYVNDSGEYTWNITGAEVFDLNQDISSDIDTDIGKLKATILARGDHRANYTDLNLNGEHADEDYYNTNISQSVIMNVQAEFDQLIHQLATKINKTLADNGYTAYPVFEEITDNGGLFSVENLQINRDLMKQASLLNFTTADDKEDFATVAALIKAFKEENLTLNSNVTAKTNLQDYYSNLVTQVANSASVFNSIYTNQETTVEEACNAREQIVGVSSDEELQNMIQFQNAYNAASRYMNVINDMLQTLLSSFGAS